MKQLLLGKEGMPILEAYEDQPVPKGYVRVQSEYGAPKHGTEWQGEGKIPMQRFIMMNKRIFSGKGRKSWSMKANQDLEICLWEKLRS